MKQPKAVLASNTNRNVPTGDRSSFKVSLVMVIGLVLLTQSTNSLFGGVSILLSDPNVTINAAAGQVIDVAAVNNDAIQYSLNGITFVSKVGNGETIGPTIESIDLIGAGLFFAGQGQNPVAGGNDRTKAETAFSLTALDLSASQTISIARITLDATGILGQFSISFDQPNTLNVATEVSGSNPPALILQAGTITVVPEPAVSILFTSLCLGSIIWLRRRRIRED